VQTPRRPDAAAQADDPALSDLEKAQEVASFSWDVIKMWLLALVPLGLGIAMIFTPSAGVQGMANLIGGIELLDK